MVDINKFSIGATAAITTSMGLIAGLAQGDGAKTSVVTGLLVIAVADNISDSLGIHIYKESEGASKSDTRSSTFGNFFVRLVLALTFVAIVLLFQSRAALVVASVWGLILLALLSRMIARKKKTRTAYEIAWHLGVALFVIAASRLMGHLILTRLN